MVEGAWAGHREHGQVGTTQPRLLPERGQSVSLQPAHGFSVSQSLQLSKSERTRPKSEANQEPKWLLQTGGAGIKGCKSRLAMISNFGRILIGGAGESCSTLRVIPAHPQRSRHPAASAKSGGWEKRERENLSHHTNVTCEKHSPSITKGGCTSMGVSWET
jgi:hypothetical protein